MRGKVLFLYCLCCLIWGSTWLFIKIGLSDLPPFWFAALRMAIACAVLAPMALRRGRARLSRRDWADVALAGFFQIGLDYALVFRAEQKIDSGVTAVLFATFPIWVGLLAHLLIPEEPLSRAAVAAAFLGLLGVAILEWPELARFRLGRESAVFLLFPLISAAAAAFANVWMKRRLTHVHPATNLWGQTLVGSIFLFLLSATLEPSHPGPWSLRAAGSLLYLALLGTVVTFLSLFWLIPRIPLSTIGAIPLIETLLAVLLGMVILGEPAGTRLFAGAAFILTGAALAARSPSKGTISGS